MTSARLHEQLLAEQVRELAPDRGGRRHRQQRRHHDPGVAGLAALEVGDDARQGVRHHRRGEHRHEEGEQQAGQRLEHLLGASSRSSSLVVGPLSRRVRRAFRVWMVFVMSSCLSDRVLGQSTQCLRSATIYFAGFGREPPTSAEREWSGRRVLRVVGQEPRDSAARGEHARRCRRGRRAPAPAAPRCGLATEPARKSPARGPPATTTMNTPWSRPRSWSGAATWRIVLR